MRYKIIVAVFILGLTCSACETLPTYDGAHRPTSEVARIRGDLRVRAGAPLSIILRRVDDIDLGLRYSGVDVLPGEHHLLIDCTVTETGNISRHHLDVNLEAGGRYKLVAATAPGNRECSDVQLIEK